MKLKEIKPGMVIHCKNDDEKKALLEEAERLGYVWYCTKDKPTEKSVHDIGDTIHFYDAGTTSFSAGYKHITHSYDTGDFVIEFSDLILPELTAEEAIKAYAEMCHTMKCEYCKLNRENNGLEKICRKFCMENTEEALKIITDWKSDREEKEPEIETVDICRIIEVLPDGRKRCVHEEDLNSDGEMLFTEQIENILKHYCMEHDGEFIAVHEVVSRVKAVK